MLEGHARDATAVAFSADGRQLVSAGLDRLALRWDLATRRKLGTLGPQGGVVHAVLFGHPEGAWIATACGSRPAPFAGENAIRIWDATTGALLLTLTGHADHIAGLACNPDGTQLASCSYDKTVKIWDPRTGALPRTLEGHTQYIFAVAFSPDGRRLASATDDGLVKIGDANEGAEVLPLKGHTDGVRSVAFDPNGERLATGCRDKTVRIWDAASGREVR